MQIGATPITPNNIPASLPNQGVAASAVRQAMDLDATIAGYYSRPDLAVTPLYADPLQPSVLNTTTGGYIRGQLMKLNDKAVSLLTAHRGDAVKATLQGLQSGFMDKLDMGKLSDEERHYFYSKPFKGKYEQMVATADRAAPEDVDAAMNDLEALCILLHNPSRFFMNVVGQRVITDFADEFNKETGASLGAQYPRA